MHGQKITPQESIEAKELARQLGEVAGFKPDDEETPVEFNEKRLETE